MLFGQDGVVLFTVDARRTELNYKVTVVDEKLSIWMEDCATKLQWRTRDLALDEFVTVDTVIPKAKPTDYAIRFAEGLAAQGDDPTYSRTLSRPTADGSRELAITFKLNFAGLEVELNYKFTLAAVQLNPTDVLSAQLRDLQRQWENERMAILTTIETLQKEKDQERELNRVLLIRIEDLEKQHEAERQAACEVDDAARQSDKERELTMAALRHDVSAMRTSAKEAAKQHGNELQRISAALQESKRDIEKTIEDVKNERGDTNLLKIAIEDIKNQHKADRESTGTTIEESKREIKALKTVVENMKKQSETDQRQLRAAIDEATSKRKSDQGELAELKRDCESLMSKVAALSEKSTQQVCSVLKCLRGTWRFADGFSQRGLEIVNGGRAVRFKVGGIYDISCNDGNCVEINEEFHAYGLVKIKANGVMPVGDDGTSVSVTLVHPDDQSAVPVKSSAKTSLTRPVKTTGK